MKNTYKTGDRVLIIKNFYTITQNDILIFQANNENLIKRCVGLSGESIKIIKGSIYSNNLLIPFPKKSIIGDISSTDTYSISEIFFTYNRNWNINNFGVYTIPHKGMKISLTPQNISLYGKLIMEDNLNKAPNLKKPTYIFQNNYFFLIGDNRPVSVDSRFFGPIKESNIKGKVMINLFYIPTFHF